MSGTIETPLPHVYAYLDFRAFLSDWFDAKKATNPRYSHRAFVAKTGQRSPSMLADVIAGRRALTAAGLDGFVNALGLKGEQARFFRLLVEFEQAPTPEEKNHALTDILSTQRFREARKLEGAGFEYLSTWYLPAIRELANRDDFRDDPAWVAKQLRPPISKRDAAKALELLFELELLVRDGDTITHGGGSVVTPHEVTSLAVQNYHRGMLELAGSALHEVDAAQRHFLGVTVSVPPELIGELKAELNAMQQRLLELCAGSESPADQVFQFNLHFFPLTNDGS